MQFHSTETCSCLYGSWFTCVGSALRTPTRAFSILSERRSALHWLTPMNRLKAYLCEEENEKGSVHAKKARFRPPRGSPYRGRPSACGLWRRFHRRWWNYADTNPQTLG